MGGNQYREFDRWLAARWSEGCPLCGAPFGHEPGNGLSGFRQEDGELTAAHQRCGSIAGYGEPFGRYYRHTDETRTWPWGK